MCRYYSLVALFCLTASLAAQVPVLENPAAVATTADAMRPYRELIEHTDEAFELVPIPGGRFMLGSPAGEAGRKADEGPQVAVEVEPFWMSRCEITWDVYDVWMSDLDIVRREAFGFLATQRDALALPLTISKPTKPYTDMTFGMGKRGFPAICMTQHAARTFCQWLSAKTGRYYRLPTEAEWEYACRAGTTTAYSFGDDPASLGDYAWYVENSEEKYHPVGQKRPNPWGLHDMHGNVCEWVLDQYDPAHFASLGNGPVQNPLHVPVKEYPRCAKGGSWDDKAERCRSAVRRGSSEEWKQQDPQDPQSVWYFTDALWLGFRVVRPLREPTAEEKGAKWEKSLPMVVDEGGKE
jgi:formylglycine-generating enzyme required for sulfatase activity